MPDDPKTIKITVVVPEKVRDEVKAKAEIIGTTLSEVVRSKLLEWLAEPLPDLTAWRKSQE